MLTGRQIRDARKLVGWSRAELGRHSAVPVIVLAAAESADGAAWLSDVQELAIRQACDQFGIEFGVVGSTPFSVRWRAGAGP